ncbi:MAG: DinB family protein [Actinomycetota bacterium]
MSEIISELQKIAENAQTTFGNLSAEQINWKPSAEGWSVGQCLDHLIKSNEAFNPVFEKFKTGERKNSFWENYSPLTGFFGNFLLKSLNNDAKKFKAPSKAIVPPSAIAPDIVGQFVRHQTEVIKTIKSLGNVDLQKTVVTSPFLKLMTYRLDLAFEIAVAHEKRHIRQAERVTKAEGFPK